METCKREIYQIVVDILLAQPSFNIGKQSCSCLDVFFGIKQHRIPASIVGCRTWHELHQSAGTTLGNDLRTESRLNIRNGSNQSPVYSCLFGIMLEQAVERRNMTFLNHIFLWFPFLVLSCFLYLGSYDDILQTVVDLDGFLTHRICFLLNCFGMISDDKEIQDTHTNNNNKDYCCNYCCQTYVGSSRHNRKKIKSNA